MPFAWRTLVEAGLGGPAHPEAATGEAFKEDPRSRVWPVPAGEHVLVVKQFVYAPLRQRLARRLHCHPAQRELDRQRRMARAGLPVVPIVDTGAERCGRGCKLWLATPLRGVSLQRRLKAASPDEAATLIDAAAALTHRLLAAGWTFKDLKPSNIVVDELGALWLIDVGSARPMVTPAQTARMIGVMTRVLGRDGVSEELRQRYVRATRG